MGACAFSQAGARGVGGCLVGPRPATCRPVYLPVERGTESWGAQLVSRDWRVATPIPGVGSKAWTAEEGTHVGREFVLSTFNKAGDL